MSMVVIPPLRREPSSWAASRRVFAVGVCAIGAVLLAAAPAIGALYKWTDANGRVIYSDQPPPGNVKVETINAPPPPDNPNAAKDLANKEVELQKKKLVRAEDDAGEQGARRRQPQDSGVPAGAWARRSR